jgi:hypothetical protein
MVVLRHRLDDLRRTPALNGGVNERRLRRFPMLSMVGQPAGNKPLMLGVRQAGQAQLCPMREYVGFARPARVRLDRVQQFLLICSDGSIPTSFLRATQVLRVP